MNLNQRINERAALVKWANDTERYLTYSITGKRLINSGDLKGSVKHNILGLTSDIKTFIFRYYQYGMYVDMGLFGGNSLATKKDYDLIDNLEGKRGKQRKNRSKRSYQWYSRTMYGAVKILGDRLIEIYGLDATNAFMLPEIMEI